MVCEVKSKGFCGVSSERKARSAMGTCDICGVDISAEKGYHELVCDDCGGDVFVCIACYELDDIVCPFCEGEVLN